MNSLCITTRDSPLIYLHNKIIIKGSINELYGVSYIVYHYKMMDIFQGNAEPLLWYKPIAYNYSDITL